MRHRIFIAINLPEDIKKKLTDYQAKWLELPCRWTKKENLHITLMFLGYLSDEELLEILKILAESLFFEGPVNQQVGFPMHQEVLNYELAREGGVFSKNQVRH